VCAEHQNTPGVLRSFDFCFYVGEGMSANVKGLPFHRVIIRVQFTFDVLGRPCEP
jgi:hypothetical protein